jgi:hypothetical protein
VPWWHGSFASSPKTGTVQAEAVSAAPAPQPGSRFSPKTYWVPSVVVTFQYSPSLSPLTVPVVAPGPPRRSTLEPSSLANRQVSPERTSSLERPLSMSITLSCDQHRSPESLCPSSWHGLYRRSTYPGS